VEAQNVKIAEIVMKRSLQSQCFHMLLFGNWMPPVSG